MTELQSSLPLIALPNGAQIVLEAIDPSSGFPASGVTVANVAITYDADAGAGADVPLPAVLGYQPGAN